MVKVEEIRLVETCLDSSVIKEIDVSEPLDEPLMRAMAHDARLRFYPHFPRPYFRIERARAYVIQGILGNRTFRVTFSPAADQGTERELQRLIES
jgi:hypothetical protein